MRARGAGSDSNAPAGATWELFRYLMWAGAAMLLALPLAAMQFTSQVDWTAFDFLVMGAMLAIAAGTVELAIRASSDSAYRLGAIVAVGTGFLLAWVNLAVGFLGSEDNVANLMFLAVLLVAIAGAAVARSDPRAMALAMAAAAAAQLLAGAIGYFGGPASTGAQGLYEVVMGTALFTGLWTASALLFRRSAAKAAR